MPKNNNVNHEPLYVKPKWDEPGDIKFIDQMEAIDVKIFDAPTESQFRNSIATFMTNTWNDRPDYGPFDGEVTDKVIHELFAGNILPAGMEIIGLCFGINGMNMIDTTHLIRHRMFSFSAQTHADRDMRDDRVVVSPQIIGSKFYDRYLDAVLTCHDIYMDMVDSKEVDMLEARTIMPAAFERFYMCRACIKDVIAYCNLRSDEQIQPYADVIISMKLWLEVLKLYPFLRGLIDFRKPDWFYVKQCSAGKTNIFPPLPKNDTFEWAETQFLYDKSRDQFPGYKKYNLLREYLLKQIEAI
jgi:thymidylate synthase (FAD)